MSRTFLIASVAAAGLLAGGLLLMRSRTESRAPVVASPPAAASPARNTSPRVPSAAAPAPAADRPVARRSPPKAAITKPTGAAPDTRATLVIRSDVAGAQVFLDREFVGAAPITARGVTPGAHQLNVSAPGFDAHVETIDVSPGERTITISFREVRLDASIDVVHKHRLGSCRGRLLATPQGVRYETTDTDDVFSAQLLELETFQIDYLEKNLRIQPRRGKSYNFTDPDGNADRLFVFHRDVERARQRLKKGDVPGGR